MKRKILIALLAIVAVLVAVPAVAALFVDIPFGVVFGLATPARPEHSAHFYPYDTRAYVAVDAKPTFGNIGELLKLRSGFSDADVLREFFDGPIEGTGPGTGTGIESVDMPSDFFKGLFERTATNSGGNLENGYSWTDFRRSAVVTNAERLLNFFNDLFGGTATDTGIQLEDVVPWIDFRHSVGVTDTAAIAIIGVRNRDRAADFVPVLIEKGMDASVADFAFRSDGGIETWVPANESELLSLALTDDWLVVATEVEGLRDVLELMSGGAETSLLDNPHFIEASATMLDGHFASAYLNPSADDVQTIKLVDVISGLFGEPAWIAASAAWIDDGIVVELVMPAGPDYGFEVPDLPDPGGLVPAGTLAFAAASFDPDLDKWRAALADYSLADDVGMDREAIEMLLGDGFFGVEVDAELQGGDNPSLADLLDYSLLSVSEVLDVDLESDVLGNLSGNAVVGVPDYEFNQAGLMFGATPDEVFAALSHVAGGGEALLGTLDGFLDTMGFRPRSTHVGGNEDATTFRLRDFRPTYLLNDGYLVIGSTTGAVEQAVGVQNGDLPGIGTDEEYRRAIEALPDDGSVLVYVGLKDVFARMAEASEGVDAAAYGMFSDNLASVAAVYGSRAGHTRATFVLTLFPE